MRHLLVPLWRSDGHGELDTMIGAPIGRIERDMHYRALRHSARPWFPVHEDVALTVAPRIFEKPMHLVSLRPKLGKTLGLSHRAPTALSGLCSTFITGPCPGSLRVSIPILLAPGWRSTRAAPIVSNLRAGRAAGIRLGLSVKMYCALQKPIKRNSWSPLPEFGPSWLCNSCPRQASLYPTPKSELASLLTCR